MSRSSSEREINIKEEIRYEWRGFAVVNDSFEDAGVSLNADRIADWWLEKFDTYADQKIKQMFEEENNRNEGKIKVRTENGILLLTPEEFEEYRKTLNGALLREVK